MNLPVTARVDLPIIETIIGFVSVEKLAVSQRVRFANGESVVPPQTWRIGVFAGRCTARALLSGAVARDTAVMSRLFVALVPPPAVLAEVERAVAPLRDAWPHLTWVEPANRHLTLAFLGEVDDRVRPELSVRLARAARHHAPLPLALGEAGTFTGRGGANTLWLAVREPGRLARLAGSLAAGARRAGAGNSTGAPIGRTSPSSEAGRAPTWGRWPRL